jgi:hypothetical protein
MKSKLPIAIQCAVFVESWTSAASSVEGATQTYAVRYTVLSVRKQNGNMRVRSN